MQMYQLKNPAATAKLALDFTSSMLSYSTVTGTKEVAQSYLLLLKGEMGAGKTHFVKALGSALNIANTIDSPTFILAKEYQGSYNSQVVDLRHIDLWRLESLNGLEELGVQVNAEVSEGIQGVQGIQIICVEWAEKLNPDYLKRLNNCTVFEVNFAIVSNQPEQRQITIAPL